MLVQAEDTKILLDAGISASQLQKRLSKFRVSLEDLDKDGVEIRSGQTLRGGM